MAPLQDTPRLLPTEQPGVGVSITLTARSQQQLRAWQELWYLLLWEARLINGGYSSSAALAIHSATPQDSERLTSSWDDHITMTEVSPCCAITDRGIALQTLERVQTLSLPKQMNKQCIKEPPANYAKPPRILI